MPLSVDDYRAFLRQHEALIVHFSGSPKGVGLPIYYPENLTRVLSHSGLGLSCSLITPNDTRANAFGGVGLILDIQHACSVISVRHDDGGSSIDPITQRRGPRDADITIAKCNDSLIRRGQVDARVAHNEWAIEDYVVKGLFRFPDADVCESEGCEPRAIMSEELARTFPALEIYSLGEGRFAKRLRADEWVWCTHPEIYRW